MYAIGSRMTQTDLLRDRFEHAFKRLTDEIQAYLNDWKVWIKEGEIRNSAGNLSLFLIQLISHTAILLTGKEQPVSDRGLTKFMSKSELAEKIEEVRGAIMQAVTNMPKENLEQDFPLTFLDKPVSVSSYLTYLLTEIYFHLGQINYHRKLV